MELAFRTKARFHAPPNLIEYLRPVVGATSLSLILDLDELETPVDRVMLLALQAIARTNVRIVLISHDEVVRLGLLRRGIPLAWISADRPRHEIAHVRQRVPGIQIIAVAPELDTIPLLGTHDRVIDARCDQIRAVLWWMAHARAVKR